jgi:hypothetical protein
MEREKMSSSETKEKAQGNNPVKDNDYQSEDSDSLYEKWDEWYDYGEIENRKAKIRRSKKRSYKQNDEW